jgi:D-cysteine desulfhydrase family pyridoxal phosphate-dependent enzyme
MKKIPKVKIAHLPTPIEPLLNLTAFLKGPNIFVKRDDQTGLAFGGNKARKLEFLVAEAKEQGALTLITAGAIQSNHCRQTAAAAAKFGLNCTLVLAGDEPDKPTANYLLDRIFDAEIIWTTWENKIDALDETYNKLKTDGLRPYLVPYGGSSPTGAIGYAYAVEELLNQKCEPDWIVFPSSSGGTQAGLVAGAKIFSYSGKILGISVDEEADVLKKRVAGIASEVTQRFGSPYHFKGEEIMVNDEFNATGYGNTTEDEWEAIKTFARLEGLLLDPVYTGRAAAGLINLIRHGFFSIGETVLFWHTGGTPGLFADKYQDLINTDVRKE